MSLTLSHNTCIHMTQELVYEIIAIAFAGNITEQILLLLVILTHSLFTILLKVFI